MFSQYHVYMLQSPQYHKISKYGKKLADKKSYVYIEKHLGQDPCRFERDGSEWCVDLDLGTKQTKACGTRVSYPTVSWLNFLSEENLVATNIAKCPDYMVP